MALRTAMVMERGPAAAAAAGAPVVFGKPNLLHHHCCSAAVAVAAHWCIPLLLTLQLPPRVGTPPAACGRA